MTAVLHALAIWLPHFAGCNLTIYGDNAAVVADINKTSIIRTKYSASVSTLASLSDKPVKAKTIEAYLTGLRSHYIDIGYSGTEIVHT